MCGEYFLQKEDEKSNTENLLPLISSLSIGGDNLNKRTDRLSIQKEERKFPSLPDVKTPVRSKRLTMVPVSNQSQNMYVDGALSTPVVSNRSSRKSRR